MCPVSVQGENAVPEMLKTLDTLYSVPDVDVAIIGRGGGSIEDLWAFSDENLARKIYESPFPVISAVNPTLSKPPVVFLPLPTKAP